ncbi:radical SAM protein, partial [bacterium SM23_31]
MYKPKYITRLENIPQLTEREIKDLQQVSKEFVFRTNEYYQSLINWDDPFDPIRRIVIPDVSELSDSGKLDASDENAYIVVPGCELKYRGTALLLVNDVCGAYCRFCFRKRLFMDDNDEVVRDVSPGIAYIKEHTEISNVLLTGGDPLLMSTRKLENIIKQIREIDHVHIIRIGTKIPAFNPYRILNDETIVEMLSKYSTAQKKIYVILHFNHPRELTDAAIQGIE